MKVVVATAVFVLVGLATVKVVVATAVFVVEFGEPFRNACAIATVFFVVGCDFVFVFVLVLILVLILVLRWILLACLVFVSSVCT